MQPVPSVNNYNIQGGKNSAFVATQMYSTANAETSNDNMPITAGMLPLTLRAGNPPDHLPPKQKRNAIAIHI